VVAISPCRNDLLPTRLAMLAVLVSFLTSLHETTLRHPLLTETHCLLFSRTSVIPVMMPLVLSERFPKPSCAPEWSFCFLIRIINFKQFLFRIWRKVSVTPVFKKGKKEDPGNYRPVSLTSTPGKMMARLILDVISKQVEEKKVIRSSLYGFTKGKSYLTSLIAFYDGMTG